MLKIKTIICGCVCLLTPLAYGQGTTSQEAPAERSVSRGGFFVEPILSFSRDDLSIKTSQLPIIADDTSGTAEAVGLGARLGGHVSEVVFLGVDGRYARSNFSDSAYGDAEANSWTAGPTLGLQTPYWGIRVFATYVFWGGYDPESGAQNFDMRFDQPYGPRVGAGIHIGPVSVNFEYQNLTFNQTQIESFGLIDATAGSDLDFEMEGYTASLSFPMEL